MKQVSQISLPTLLCGEDESCFDNFNDECFNINCNFSPVSEFDSEYIQMLIRKETIFQSKYSAEIEGIWWKRRDAVEWILDRTVHFGYNCRTAYLSLFYLDRFLSRRSVDEEKPWAMRLLSIACLSLAAKLEEREARSLSEYDSDGYSFGGGVIQRMELLVLNTLEWKMSCITPFTYLSYFATLFSSEFRLNRAVELILSIMAEINVTDHRPSVVAAAAVLAACNDHHLTNETLEIKIDAVPSWGPEEKQEHTLFCYSLLQQTVMSKFDDDDWMRGSSRKRRLTFIGGDQDCPQPKTPKQ
ncbi:cyclin-D5-1-like isoform X1 [Salvia splendens]|uniref:cyclin-D5-1-like isoform X1 n=1 Tax=Salvia splendens TaxID=180675 RepID=UPI001C2600D8|nr:cyclin-D5-1-like isoform X1 [Salvia splendens]